MQCTLMEDRIDHRITDAKVEKRSAAFLPTELQAVLKEHEEVKHVKREIWVL